MRYRISMGSFALFLSGVSVFSSFALAGWIAYCYPREFPSVAVLKSSYPVVHYLGEDHPSQVRLQRFKPQTWVNLKTLPRSVVGAVVVSEDWAFYQHKGYDPNQILESLKRDWRDGRFSRGASTITQQVVRNVFLDQDKNVWRKLKELYLATELEDTLRKDRILEIYLNIAEWGAGIYGIRGAAHHYFQKLPENLSAKEGAFLAMLLPSPKRYSQSFKSRRLTQYGKSTIESILGKMVRARYLTEEEMIQELETPFSFEES